MKKKNLLQQMEAKVDLETLDLKAQQIERQENLPKELSEKNMWFGYN